MQKLLYVPDPAAHVSRKRKPSILRVAAIALGCGLLSLGCSHSAQPEPEWKTTETGRIRYLHHQPVTAATQHVILAHGFLRTAGTMEHLGKALAERGIETACIELRHSRPWSGNHAENARDMIALSKALGWEKVIYAGFSAGGLSALLAAADDPACTKLVLLDPVDSGTLGTDGAPKVRVPTLAILGKPGPGNANRNATPMLKAIPRCQIVELPEATHCDFEARPSELCYRLTGGKPDPARVLGIHAAIIRESRTFLSAPTKP